MPACQLFAGNEDGSSSCQLKEYWSFSGWKDKAYKIVKNAGWWPRKGILYALHANKLVITQETTLNAEATDK